MPDYHEHGLADPRYSQIFSALADVSLFDEETGAITYRPGPEGVKALVAKRELMFKLLGDGLSMEDYDEMSNRAAQDLKNMYSTDPEDFHAE